MDCRLNEQSFKKKAIPRDPAGFYPSCPHASLLFKMAPIINAAHRASMSLSEGGRCILSEKSVIMLV